MATATVETIALAVANHLDLFDGVLASTCQTNLKGKQKLEAIQMHSGGRAFEYWGDSAADCPIFERAERGLLVFPGKSLRRRVEKLNPGIEIIERPDSAARAIFKSARIYQWIKNVLVFVPILTAHRILDPGAQLTGAFGFLIFGLIASSHYMLNDLFDVPFDRVHPLKRFRPVASGELSIPVALTASLVLAGCATVLIFFTPVPFRFWVLAYFLIANAYSLILKRKLLVDVLGLCSLYTVRIMAGGAISGITVSEWLISYSMLFFTSLAFVKRFTELVTMLKSGDTGMMRGRGYQIADLEIVRVVGPASGMMALVVLALYVSSPAVSKLYKHPEFLWVLCPLFGYWIVRMWFIANRGHLHHDPIVFALRDSRSWLVGTLAIVTMMAAAW